MDRDILRNIRTVSIENASRAHAHKGRTIGTDVVFVGAVLAALSSHPLELLLGGCIRIADLQWKTFTTNEFTSELVDDLVADIA